MARETTAMRLPRFRLRTIMIVVALAALGMGLARWWAEVGAIYFVLLMGVPAVAAPGEQDGPIRLRPDAKRSAFGYLAAVVGPAFCVLFDPFVFRHGLFGFRPILGSYRPFCYLYIIINMILMTCWLVARPTFAPACALIAGAFWAAVVFAVGIGLALLPISVSGLFFFAVGIFGFTPFLTAFAFYRQGRLALTAARPLPLYPRLALQLVGAALAVAPAAVAQVVFD
ncbi:MAG TPA: hypothetical protein VG406_03930 [Isosphaeraceae bacterium]|jgi:hypothetical protein|nr:hypothetical protein [Isosphaeraceae bacterium]